jgi:glutathione peroxidase
MGKILIACFCLAGLFQTSIYSYSFTGISGSTINLNDFRGKKILLVNIATNSKDTAQLGQLEELYQTFHDSLVIIAFPSNSFGNEPRTNAGIDSFCQANYHYHFIIAEKADVKGSSMQSVYSWLASSSENGVINAPIERDFEKYLINGNGDLIGLYAHIVEPTSTTIRNAITDN